MANMSVAISKNKPAAVLPAVAVIGCGNMGGAIIRGLRLTGYSDSANIVGCDTDPERLQTLADDSGIRLTSDPVDAGRGADVLIIAVKPKLVEAVVKQLAAGYSKKDRPVIVSIAAGVTVKQIARAWGSEDKIVSNLDTNTAVQRLRTTPINSQGKRNFISSQTVSVASFA